MRRSAILCLLLAFNAGARTVTIEGGWPIELCDNPTLTHYADNTLVIVCVWPNGKKRVTVSDCPRPKLTPVALGNYSLAC